MSFPGKGCNSTETTKEDLKPNRLPIPVGVYIKSICSCMKTECWTYVKAYHPAKLYSEALSGTYRRALPNVTHPAKYTILSAFVHCRLAIVTGRAPIFSLVQSLLDPKNTYPHLQTSWTRSIYQHRNGFPF